MNLCPASVLDRLNCLLEPGGKLLLAESGLQRVVVPQPNFRIFFTMDPVFGEISRALRNRCVEIYFLNECDATQTLGENLLSTTTASLPQCTEKIPKISNLVNIETIFSGSHNVALCKVLSYSLIGKDPSLIGRMVLDGIDPNRLRFAYDIEVPIALGLSRNLHILSTVLTNLVFHNERCTEILSRSLDTEIIHWSSCVQKSSMEQLDSLLGGISEFCSDLVVPHTLALLAYEHLYFVTPYSTGYLKALFEVYFSDLRQMFFSILDEACDLQTQPEIALSALPAESIDFLIFRWAVVRIPMVMKEYLSLQSSSVFSGNDYSSLSLFQVGHAVIEKRILVEDLLVAIVHSVTKILSVLDESIQNLVKNRVALQRHIGRVYPFLRVRDMLSRSLLASFLHVRHRLFYTYFIALRIFHGRL